jgi:uncharacterized protein
MRAHEWDPDKERANIGAHGLSFSLAAQVFADPNRLVLDTTRPQDRESRSKMLGVLADRVHCAVFTMRGDAVRLISFRRANTAKIKAYFGQTAAPDRLVKS